MIDYKHVAKSYAGDAVALQDINLHITDGEFIFLVGPSGAGKTSLFRLLLHEEIPTDGEVWLNDIPVHALRARQVPKLRRHIGMIFQDFRLLPRLTVWENVAFALE